jgi:hypothetical protein
MARGMMAMAAAMMCAIAMIGAQAPSSQFSPAGIDDPKRVDRFLEDLQKAVADDNAAEVALLARYPTDVTIDKKRRRVRSKAEMEKMYAQIFTPCLKRVVAAAKSEDLFANGQGVNLGQGAMWFGMQANGRIQFFTINGPADDEPLCKDTH